MTGVFINYRRADSRDVTMRIVDHLVREFGEDHVFVDTEDIEYGSSFPEVIERALASADSLVAIIGPEWEDIADSQGRRRLDNPDDFVRKEIAHALARGIRVVPVLVRGAGVPAADRLPSDIADLVNRNAIELGAKTFRADLDRLVETLRGPDIPLLGFWSFAGAAFGRMLSSVLWETGKISQSGTLKLWSALSSATLYGAIALGILWSLRKVLGLEVERVLQAVLFVMLGAGAAGALYDTLAQSVESNVIRMGPDSAIQWGLITVGLLYGTKAVSGLSYKRILLSTVWVAMAACLGGLGRYLLRDFADAFIGITLVRKSIPSIPFWVSLITASLIIFKRDIKISLREIVIIIPFVMLGSFLGALVGELIRTVGGVTQTVGGDQGGQIIIQGIASGLFYSILAIAVSYGWKRARSKPIVIRSAAHEVQK